MSDMCTVSTGRKARSSACVDCCSTYDTLMNSCYHVLSIGIGIGVYTLIDLWEEDNIYAEDLFHVANDSFLLQVRDNLTVHTSINCQRTDW